MIKSTKCYIYHLNHNKLIALRQFINEYRKILYIVIKDISNLKSIPNHIDYKPYKLLTCLSARILRRLTDQAVDITIGVKRSNNPNRIPNTDKINPSLNKNNYDIRRGNYFDEFISLKCLGMSKINIPINYHRGYLANGIK